MTRKKEFCHVSHWHYKNAHSPYFTLSSSCYLIRVQRIYFLADNLSTAPRRSTQNDARMALSFQKLRRPRYLPISPIVKWDPLRHHFSEKRRRSTAHCAQDRGHERGSPRRHLESRNAWQPYGRNARDLNFLTYVTTGTFRDNFIGRRWDRNAVAKFASNPSSSLIFPVSCANGLFNSVISLFFY